MSNYLSQELILPCGQKLSNRFSKAAMSEGLADSLNRATARHSTLYRRWAEGGAGLLVSGNVLVDRTHLERPGNIVIDSHDGLESLRDMAKAGTCTGNHFWMQINHPGRQTPINIQPEPLAPSSIPLRLAGKDFGMPREMTEAQIEDVIRRFVHVASVARECGFTGVQVHAAHGYLLSQFLSPLSNHRSDAWGGSLENRARLLLEIVRATRKAVGNDFPISVKLNSADFQKGGFSSDESTQVVRWLSEESVDLLEISGGNYESQAMMGRSEGGQSSSTNGAPESGKQKAESTSRREAYFLDYAAQVRPFATMPLMITGGFRSRSIMEGALKSGELEVIGLGRPLCAKPDLCNELLSGTATAAPTPENELLLDRAALDFVVDDSTFRTIESYSHLAWSCQQIARLGDGKDPDLKMTLLEALAAYELSETTAFQEMQRPS